MNNDVIVALIGFFGIVVGVIPTYFFMRRKGVAEVEKLNAETEKTKVEIERIKAETSEKGASNFRIDDDEFESKRYKTIHRLQTQGLEDDLHELINLFHSGVYLSLEYLDYLLKNHKYKNAQDIIPEILNRSQTSLNELRMLHTSIYGKFLEEEHFHDALHALSSVWSRRSSPLNGNKLSIIVECPKNLRIHPFLMEPLLRVMSGALVNAIFYSGIINDPKVTILLKVKLNEDQLLAQVKDTGIGTDKIVDGYGISRMKSISNQLEISKIRNELTIKSKKNEGTSVELKIFLTENAKIYILS